jgi:hypothetical protein
VKNINNLSGTNFWVFMYNMHLNHKDINLLGKLTYSIHVEIYTVEFLQSGTNGTGQVLDYQTVTILT